MNSFIGMALEELAAWMHSASGRMATNSSTLLALGLIGTLGSPFVFLSLKSYLGQLFPINLSFPHTDSSDLRIAAEQKPGRVQW